jgi:hypothetical protein
MRHRIIKTTAVATAGVAALALGSTTAQAATPSSRASCVTRAHVRHTAAVIDAYAVGWTMVVNLHADRSVSQTTTIVKPGDGPRGKAIRSGRNVNIHFRSMVDPFQLWVYMAGHGGGCTVHLAARSRVV